VLIEALLIALATAFNALIIKWKVEKGRYEDAFIDVGILVVLASLFSGSMGGMVIATISSFIVSIYLLFSPPKFFTTLNIDKKSFVEEWKKRLPR